MRSHVSNVVSAKQYSRAARKWLARLQLAYFSSIWGERTASSADVEFARDPGGIKAGALYRRKPFEGLYSEGTCLPDDVIETLERDPRFRGIRSFSLTTFWFLLGTPPVDAIEANQFVRLALTHLQHRRLSVSEEERQSVLAKSSSSGGVPTSDQSSGIDDAASNALQQIIDGELRRTCELQQKCCYSGSADEFRGRAACNMTRRLVRLDVLALLGALFRELQLTFELEAADRVGRAFWVLLEEFLSHPAFMGTEEDFKTYCVNRILYGRPDRDALRSFLPNESLRLPGKPIGIHTL